MLDIRSVFLFLAFLILTGCSRQAGEDVAIDEGFVVPSTLNLRKDLGPRQPAVGTVKHGERVEILARRRRFARVRSARGEVGWVDGALLFTPAQMGELKAIGERAAALPSQGEATALDALNVHTTPDRQSPSFYQIREKEPVRVVAHRLVPRTPPLPPDDWSLVVYSSQEAGWVLSRMLSMAIPDEVAQYAEGHRITSYFSLGDIRDGSDVKHNWLWTTIAEGRQPYEFDSFRVFVWSLRRHRYETAFIERNVQGYYPVTVEKPANAPPRFKVIVDDKDGVRHLRTYTFQGYHVRLVDKTPWTLPPAESGPSTSSVTSSTKAGAGQSWFSEMRSRLSSAWRYWFRRPGK